MKTKEDLEVVSQTVNTKAPVTREQKHNMNRNLLIVIFILLLVIILGAAGFIVYAMYGWQESTKLDLVGNIDVEDLGLEGYDGEGVLKYDESHLASLVEYDGGSGKVEDFIKSVSYTVTPDTDISNGDKITIRAEYDSGKARKAGVKVVKDTMHLVIEQLNEKDEDGYNYGDTEGDTESTDTFDDPEDDYSDEGNSDYTGNDRYSGSGIEYVTKTANGKDGYFNVRDGRSTDAEVVVKLSNGIQVDVYDLKDGWYKIATGAHKGYYIHESTLTD